MFLQERGVLCLKSISGDQEIRGKWISVSGDQGKNFEFLMFFSDILGF
jgi:hypothetical protein